MFKNFTEMVSCSTHSSATYFPCATMGVSFMLTKGALVQSYFLLLRSLLYEDTTVCWFTFLLVDMWAISNVSLL